MCIRDRTQAHPRAIETVTSTDVVTFNAVADAVEAIAVLPPRNDGKQSITLDGNTISHPCLVGLSISSQHRAGIIFFLKKIEKRQLLVRPTEWLKLNFANGVVHQTHSLGVLVLYLVFHS